MEEVWESKLQDVQSYGAYGPRDVLIISSSGETLKGPDIVPRRRVALTTMDQERLASQDILEESWGDDVKIMEARFRREESRFYLLPTLCGDGLTCQGVMEKIKGVMQNTDKPGVSIHYIGPGRRGTGDWCFADGFITFRDFIDVYMEHFHAESKCLELTSDCSFSGKWISACREFLDEVGVQPCGHSARAANILLKVRTSCRSHEIPHTLLYSARGRGNDKNTGALFVRGNGHKVEEHQHLGNLDSTHVACKNGLTFEDPCALKGDYTWHKKGEGDRTYLVRGKDKERPAWHYIRVVDDDEILDMFLEKVKTGHVDVADYGTVIKSGWGQDPPKEERERIDQMYHGTM